MTRNELLRRYPHASESFLRANTTAPALDTDSGPQLQQHKSEALEPHVQAPKPAAQRNKRVAYRGKAKPILRVFITAFTRNAIDSDNLSNALKYCRDSIAQHFGLDDADSVIDWSYRSEPTRGQLGVVVKIEKY